MAGGTKKMKTQVYVTGSEVIPTAIKEHRDFSATLVENLYDFRHLLKNDQSEKVIVVYVPFLEMKHFELYTSIQKAVKNTQTFFVVNELSNTMKVRLKGNKDFIILWKTEEPSLVENILRYLEGKEFSLRCDRREDLPTSALLGPSILPSGHNSSFKPILAGAIENVSMHGSCVQVKAPFYKPKEFVDISYRDRDGDYKSLQGQVRWISWDSKKEVQDVGIQFISSK
jgi:hypothetical protein